MIFEVYSHIEYTIRNTIESKIYLGQMVDTLYTAVMNVSNKANTSQDVLRKYEAFFEVLRKELEEKGIEKVVIGNALDITGCEVIRTIELTSSGIFICENERREAKLSDIFTDMYQPEYIIGCVVDAIVSEKNKILINMLEYGVKNVKDLVINRCSTSEETGDSLCDKKRIDNDNRHTHIPSELEENSEDNNSSRGPSK